MKRRTRLLVLWSAALWAWFAPTSVSAEPLPGLAVTAYLIDEFPPQMVDDVYAVCDQWRYDQIWHQWGGGPVGSCPNTDFVMLHYEGYLTLPDGVSQAQFLVYADDGGIVNIGGNSLGDWNLKGCSGYVSPVWSFDSGESVPLDAWFYEWGGGACFLLYWNVGQGWTPVPPEAFSSEPIVVVPSTTTVEPTTTVSETTTTVEETTTTVEQTTSTAPTTTSSSSSVAPSSSEQTTSTTSSSTTTSSTTTTVFVPPQTTTTMQEPEPPVVITTTTVEETTTTTQEETTTTVEETTTTVGVVDETKVTTATTLVEDFAKDEDDTPDVVVEELPAPVDIPDVVEEPLTVTDELVEELLSDGISEANLDEVLDVLNSERATDEQIVSIVESLVQNEVSSEVAAAVVSNPKVLQAISAEQASELFQAIDESSLTDEQAAEMVAAVQEAPKEIREEFEDKVDVFSGGFDDYVPLDSVVSIAVRRVVIGATVVVFSMPTPTVRKI